MEKYTIGRNENSDIILVDETVSGRHALLNLYPDGSIELKDDGALNRTIVRDRGSSYELDGNTGRAVQLESRVQMGHVQLSILDMLIKLVENRPPSLIVLRQYRPDVVELIQQSNPEIFKEEPLPVEPERPKKKVAPKKEKQVITGDKPRFDPITGELKR